MKRGNQFPDSFSGNFTKLSCIESSKSYDIEFVDITNISEKLKGKPKYYFRKDSTNLNNTSITNVSNLTRCYNIISIYRGRSEDKCEVGIAYMDFRTTTLNLCQFIDTPTFEILKIRLSMLDPLEVLLCDPTEDTGSHTDVIIEIAKDVCSGPEIMAISRKFFDDVKGTRLIESVASPEASNIDKTTMKQYLCISAAYCLITYLEQILNLSYAAESMQVLYECLKDRCMIDLQTCKNLNVIKDLKEKATGNKNMVISKTLFSVLNTCSTDGGEKTLRSNLLQPSCHLETITKRQNAIEELKLNENLLFKIRSQLTHVKNMEFIIASCVHIDKKNETCASRRKIQELINLRETLDKVNSIRKLVTPLKCDIISNLAKALYDKRLEEILNLISQKIDIDFKDQRNVNQFVKKNFILYAVKSENKILKIARETFEQIISEAEALTEKEVNNLTNCRLNFTTSRGFFYVIQTNGNPTRSNVPAMFLNICVKGTNITFTSRALIKLSDRINDCINEILIFSNTIIDDLLLSIRKLIPILYKVSEFISYLDFICALSYYSINRSTVKPMFSNCLIVEKGRHPLLEIQEKVVPNDVYIAPETCFMLITGPNMSGKTTYMKQVCLLQILTQIGCMIPADSGKFPVFKRIFSRLSYNDDIVTKLSGFAMEMSEIRPILKNADEQSLIAIDELGRSTSTEEGLAISFAIIEHLIASRSFTIFATHFLNLSKMALSFSSIENYHFSSDETNNANDVSCRSNAFVIKKGQYEGPLFGFNLASACGFPNEVVESAKKTAEGIRYEELKKYRTNEKFVYERRLIKLGYKLKRCISIADQHDPSEIADYLRNLKNEHLKQSL
uniref:MutS protein homolog him-14 (inferred by orthology to a C. elegans protein) n=1 Tax=Strongyloides venezuelensis TaxID=75913 RepID=A0A0K0G0Z1_STRVS